MFHLIFFTLFLGVWMFLITSNWEQYKQLTCKPARYPNSTNSCCTTNETRCECFWPPTFFKVRDVVMSVFFEKHATRWNKSIVYRPNFLPRSTTWYSMWWRRSFLRQHLRVWICIIIFIEVLNCCKSWFIFIYVQYFYYDIFFPAQVHFILQEYWIRWRMVLKL